MKPAILAILSLLYGCSVRPCDDSQRLDRNGFCVVSTTGGAAGLPSDSPGGASELGGDGGQAGAVTAAASAFGDACQTDADCHGEVSYCAVNPGATTGVCTRTGCVEDPSICPGGWTCLDLSAFSADLPPFCVPQ